MIINLFSIHARVKIRNPLQTEQEFREYVELSYGKQAVNLVKSLIF